MARIDSADLSDFPSEPGKLMLFDGKMGLIGSMKTDNIHGTMARYQRGETILLKKPIFAVPIRDSNTEKGQQRHYSKEKRTRRG